MSTMEIPIFITVYNMNLRFPRHMNKTHIIKDDTFVDLRIIVLQCIHVAHHQRFRQQSLR